MMIGDTKLVRLAFVFFAPMWCVITPLGLFAVIVFKSYQYTPVSVTKPGIYTTWADLIWWMIVAFSVCSVPVLFIAHICVIGGFQPQNIARLNKPSPKWGHYLDVHQTGRYAKSKLRRSEDKTGPFTTTVSGNDITVVYEKDPTGNGLNGRDNVTGHMITEDGYENLSYVQDNAVYTKL